MCHSFCCRAIRIKSSVLFLPPAIDFHNFTHPRAGQCFGKQGGVLFLSVGCVLCFSHCILPFVRVDQRTAKDAGHVAGHMLPHWGGGCVSVMVTGFGSRCRQRRLHGPTLDANNIANWAHSRKVLYMPVMMLYNFFKSRSPRRFSEFTFFPIRVCTMWYTSALDNPIDLDFAQIAL